MGLGKVIKAIFVIIFLLLILVGIDGYLTFQTFNGMSQTDVKGMVSNPKFTVSGTNSEIVTVTLDVDLPKAGFIPKGVIINLIIDFAGDKQSTQETVNLGESKTLSIQFTMTTTNAQDLATGGSLSVIASAEVTPVVVGYEINQAQQTIDLGTFTVTL